METEYAPLDSAPLVDPAELKVTIIYEDIASGQRAKHFAESLAERLESACPLAETMWRSDLLESPLVAELAARAAADCEYLIVSLRGDRVLPFAVRQWIEAHLDGVAEHGTWVVGLLGAYGAKRRTLDGNRHYLRCVCAAKGVEFFSLASIPPEEAEPSVFASTTTNAAEFEPWPQRLPALLPA